MSFILRRPSEGLLIGCMKMQYIECKLVARKRSSLMNHTLYEYFAEQHTTVVISNDKGDNLPSVPYPVDYLQVSVLDT
jgi:hypothetical protein